MTKKGFLGQTQTYTYQLLRRRQQHMASGVWVFAIYYIERVKVNYKLKGGENTEFKTVIKIAKEEELTVQYRYE